MEFDTSTSFRKALQIVNESQTLGDLIEQKREYFNNHEKLQRINEELAIKKEQIKRINEKYKSENFDNMTRMKYRRFRTDYHTKRNSILCNHKTELTKLENQYNINLNKINLISDDTERQKKKWELKKKYYENRHKIDDKYKKIITDFAFDYRYRIATVGLKWTYVVVEELDV